MTTINPTIAAEITALWRGLVLLPLDRIDERALLCEALAETINGSLPRRGRLELLLKLLPGLRPWVLNRLLREHLDYLCHVHAIQSGEPCHRR